jgi:hypothetical protein
MNSIEHRLRENDVRNDAPGLNADEFLRLYLASNFPQTTAFPSEEQRSRGLQMQPEDDTVKYMKKPPSGTSFDRPDRY